jgi:hypothetical protein
MYTILLDNFINNIHISDNLIYIIYVMIAIYVCILVTYSFLLSIGIIKGTVLSSKCNVESVEYESIRYQIYKIFEYFDQPLIVVLLLVFIGCIIFITLIYIILPLDGSIWFKFVCIFTFYIAMFHNYNDSAQAVNDKLTNYIIISILYCIFFMVSIKITNPDISRKVLILIFSGLLYFNYTIYNIFLLRDNKNNFLLFTQELLKAIAINICIILIFIYILKNNTLEELEKETIQKYFAGITVISVCSILFITLLYVINILGYNFKVKYEVLIDNLNKDFSKIISNTVKAVDVKPFLFRETDGVFMNNVCDYYVLLTNPYDDQINDYDQDGEHKTETNENYYIRQIHINKININKIDPRDVHKRITDKFAINYKEELQRIILNLNGNCDQLLPNRSSTTNREDLLKIHLKAEDKKNIRRLFKRFADSFIESDESFKSMQKLILNNYNALHEKKTTLLKLDNQDDLIIPDVIDKKAILYIPLFNDNPDKFVKNLKKNGIINESNESDKEIVDNLTYFTKNLNDIVNNERQNLDLNLIKMVTFIIGSIIVFIMCFAIYIAYMNAFPIGIIITIGAIIFSIMILTIVRVISEGIH